MVALPAVQWGEETLVRLQDGTERVIRFPCTGIGELDPHSPPVVRVHRTFDETGRDEPVEACGHGAGRDQRGVRQLGRVGRAAYPPERVEDVEVTERQAERFQCGDQRALEVPRAQE